jgi:hypothetical protein
MNVSGTQRRAEREPGTGLMGWSPTQSAIKMVALLRVEFISPQSSAFDLLQKIDREVFLIRLIFF